MDRVNVPDWVPPALVQDPSFFDALRVSQEARARAVEDGIPQVEPWIAHYMRPPAALREVFGAEVWRVLHHRTLMHNAAAMTLVRQSFAPLGLTLRLTEARAVSLAEMGASPRGVGITQWPRGASLLTICPSRVRAFAIAPDGMSVPEMIDLGDVIRDALRMMHASQIDAPDWSPRRWREEHDRLARESARRAASPKPFIEPWSMSYGDYTATLLVSPADIAEEGAVMRHCVASYAADAKAGDCRIVRMDGAYRGTLEVTRHGLRQFKGLANRTPPAEAFAAAEHIARAVISARPFKARMDYAMTIDWNDATPEIDALIQRESGARYEWGFAFRSRAASPPPPPSPPEPPLSGWLTDAAQRAVRAVMPQHPEVRLPQGFDPEALP